MKKLKKDDYKNIALILFLIIIYVLCITNFLNSFYGSTVDWDCQHFSIPDYFRKLFYETGNLIPNFAFNLGNGQNIFYYSYYGLLNPIILISYFLPFIEMIDYIQISLIIIVFISCILLYKWLLNKYNSSIAFFSTIVYLTITPVLFHSHRHIMFINYMPFLILSLIGVDKYFMENKRCLLIISVFLLIMTSYFFSVGSIFVITVYGLYNFIKNNKNINFKLFARETVKFLIPIIVGILMGMIIILPTLYVILSGRADSNVNINFFNLIIPNLKILNLFYSSYSPGLNALILISIIYIYIYSILYKNKEFFFLVLFITIFFLFPIFTYILNGTMYVDYKVLIPFIPILTLFVANMMFNFENNKKIINKSLVISLLIGIFVFLFNLDNNKKIIFILELLMLILCFMIKIKFKKSKLNNLFILVIVITVALFTSFNSDSLYLKDDYNNLTNSDSKGYEEVFNNEESIYRVANNNYLLQNINRILSTDYYSGTIYSSTSNNNYKSFYYNETGNEITQRTYGKITSSMNIFYNLYNANKFFVSDGSVPVGYNRVSVNDNLYVNEDVLPIIYASDNVMGYDKYKELEFPYNMEALLKNIIVKDYSNSNFESSIEDFNGSISILENIDNIKINKINNLYSFDIENTTNMKFKVDGLNKNDILMIEFSLDNNQKCSNGDLEITINEIKNVLSCNGWKYHNKNTTFNYVLSSNDVINELNVVFSKGNYVISDLKIYVINYDKLENIKNNVDEFIFDKEKTKGNYIKGNINVTKDGYLYMSIPYDEGFTIYLNGKKQNYEKVDGSFIGFKINKGVYSLEIIYNAPFLKEGKIASIIGTIIFGVIFISENRKIKKSIAKK